MDADQFGPPRRHDLPWKVPLILALATVAVVGLVGSAAYVYQKAHGDGADPRTPQGPEFRQKDFSW